MCGLVGVINPAMVFNGEKFFRNALIADTIRGPHSTGIYSVDNEGQCTYSKKAVTGPEFVFECGGYAAVVKDPYKDNMRALIGHNRWATQGAVTDKNAHPFAHGAITLVHNGTLHGNFRSLAPGQRFDTDSEHIAYALSQSTDPFGIDVLEKLDGAFALIWHDSDMNTLNIARNHSRKLYVARTKANNAALLASEGEMLSWIAGRERGVIAINEPELVPAMKVLQFDLGQKDSAKLIKPRVKEFTAPKKYYSATGNRAQQTSTRGQSTQLTSSGQTATGRTKLKDPKPRKGAMTKEFIAAWTRNNLGFTSKDSPTEVLFQVDEMTQCNTIDNACNIFGSAWEWYSHTLPRLCQQHGADPATFEVMFSAYMVPTEGYEEEQLASVSFVEGRIANIINRYDNDNKCVGVSVLFDRNSFILYDDAMQEIKPALEAPKQKKRSGGGASEDAAAPEQPDLALIPTLRGPGGVYVPEDTWSSLTSAGCCHCHQSIRRVDAELVEWIKLDGHKSYVPLCNHCQDDVAQFAPQLLH